MPTAPYSTRSMFGEIGNDHDWKLVVGGLKGGLGKSTSVWNIGWHMSRILADPVLLVCADPKSQTLSDSYRVVQATGVNVPFFLLHWPTGDGLVQGVRAEMAKVGARHVVIDTGGEGGEGETILEQSCLVGDELIIPVAPNMADLRRIPSTFSVAARVASLNPINPTILLVSCDSRTSDGDAASAWMQAPGRDWPLFRTRISTAVQYPRSLFREPANVGAYAYVLDELAEYRVEAA